MGTVSTLTYDICPLGHQTMAYPLCIQHLLDSSESELEGYPRSTGPEWAAWNAPKRTDAPNPTKTATKFA